MDPVKLEHVGAKRKISRQYIVIHETTHRGKKSSEGINTPSFFSPYHFRPADKLFHDILRVFLTLSHSRSEYMHEITKMVKFIGETEFTLEQTARL